MSIHDEFALWLDAHQADGITLPGFAPLALLAAENSQGLAAAAVVTGSGASADVSNSNLLAQQATSDPTGARDAFADRPLDGCTSLLNISRVSSGFEPSQGMTGENIAAYARYISSVQKCPLFNIDMNDSITVSRDSNDWNELISAVADTFDGVQSEDKDKIRTSVTKLVQAAASNSDTTESSDLFVQSVINSANDVYEIYIYSSHVELTDHKSKGSEHINEKYTITRTKLTFRIGDWPTFAPAVWDKQYSSVNDWLNQNSTPSGGKTKLVTCLV